MATTVVDALVATFGLDPSGVEEGVKVATGSLEELKATALKVFAAIGAAALIKSAFSNYLIAADAVGKLSIALSENASALQAWGGAAALEGGSIEEFNGTVKKLNTSLVEMATTGGGEAAQFFEKLGIKATDASGKVKPATEVMLELSDSFGKLSAQQAAGIGEKIGLDAGTIGLLRKGRAGIEELLKAQKELGEFTQKDIDAASEFNDTFDMTVKGLSMVATKIFTLVTPAITGLLKVILPVIVQIRKWADSLLVMLEPALSSISEFVKEHGVVLTTAFVAITAIILGMYVPAMLTAAASTLAAMAPFLLIAGVIAAVGIAIGLLVEDFLIWQDGGESAIGSLLGDFDTFYAKVKPLLDGLGVLFSSMFTAIMSPAKLLFGFLVALFTGDFAYFMKVIDDLEKAFFDVWGLIKAPAAQFFDWVLGKFAFLTDAFKSVKGFLGMAAEEVEVIPPAEEERRKEVRTLERAGQSAVSEDVPMIPTAETSPQRVATTKAPTPTPKAFEPPKNAVRASESLSPMAINNAKNDNSKTITATQSIGTVNITTAATDPSAVAKSFSRETGDNFEGMVMAADSGVSQ